MAKPVIGVVPLVDKERQSLWMLPRYLEAISAAGGVGVMLPLTSDTDEIVQLADQLDGILLTGGQDVDPQMYDQARSAQCGELCHERDSMEALLVEQIMKDDIPCLGICRGLQLLNVMLGGTLYQDLDAQHPSNVTHHMERPYDRVAHGVEVRTRTPLSSLVGGGSLGVNSCHHQAVKDLAPELVPMATSEDGIIEAAYIPDHRFAWGVQWHPELSFRTDIPSISIFETFVASCRQQVTHAATPGSALVWLC